MNALAHILTGITKDQETIGLIGLLVSEEFNVDAELLLNFGNFRNKSTDVVWARRFLLAFLRVVLAWPVPRICRSTGLQPQTIRKFWAVTASSTRFSRFCFKVGRDERARRLVAP